ncbi:MAG: ATP-binding cassette domain-containing protein [Candidatus Omnitrophota bacterium]
MENNSLLKINNLKIGFGSAPVVDGLFMEIAPAQIVALVGGSGSGKTLTALAILNLLPLGAQVKSGEIIFRGEDLLSLSQDRMRQVRGRDIAMIFQEPLSAFNPLFTVGNQIAEVLLIHSRMQKRKLKSRVSELLSLAGVPEPERVAYSYPHQLSAGLRQRAMLAQVIALKPCLIIADEPTSNLDVTIQAQIMELFRTLKNKFGLSILLITHDLAMVGHIAERVAILSGGKIVEAGPTQEILHNPAHSFTRQLKETALL